MNLLRILGEVMRDMPERDSPGRMWHDWYQRRATAYEQIAAYHLGIAAEARALAHQARLEAAMYVPIKGGAACAQPLPAPVWARRDQRRAL